MERLVSNGMRRVLGCVIAALTAACGASTMGFDVAETSSDVTNDTASVDAADDTSLDARRDAPADTFEAGPDIVRDTVPLAGDELWFVMSRISVDMGEELAVPHFGFDLDGLASAATDVDGCNHSDYFSSIDLDQNTPSGCMSGAAGCRGGVDNQLPTVLTTLGPTTGVGDLGLYMNDEIQANRLVMMMRISGVDDVMNDPQVRVQIVQGYPTFTTMCDTLLPDRTYRVARSTLTPGGRTLEDALFSADGRIVAGRLQVAGTVADSFIFPLPVAGGRSLNLSARSARVRFDITRTTGMRGNFGAVLPGGELLTTLGSDFPQYLVLLETLLGTLVDVRVGGICSDRVGGMRRYGGLSLGFGFELLPARIDAMRPIDDGPVLGACGG